VSRYLFDSNLFRGLPYPRPGESESSVTLGEQVKRAVIAGGDRIVACVETIYEFVSHINEEEKADYYVFHKAISALLHYTDETVIEHADYGMQKRLLGEPRHKSVAGDAIQLARVLRDITQFDGYYSSPVVYETPGGIAVPLLAHLRLLKEQELDAWEREWASDMTTSAELILGCDYREAAASGIVPQMTDKAKRDKALKDLGSENIATALMVGIALRTGLTDPVSEGALRTLSDGLCAFYCGYKGIWRKALESGYDFFSRRNLGDFIDMQLLMHLIEDDVVLVTNDGRLKRLVPDTCKQADRIMRFDQLAEQLGVA